MKKQVMASILGITFILAGQAPYGARKDAGAAEPQFEVLSPWAEADPIPPRGISPRLDSLAGRKIGLFANFKRASRPIVAEVEARLKAAYPGLQTILFDSQGANVVETDTANAEKFRAWMKEADAAVLAVGD